MSRDTDLIADLLMGFLPDARAAEVEARLEDEPGRVAIYGWHGQDGSPIQPVYTGHTDRWVDYSHGIRLVSRRVVVDGVEHDLVDLLEDPELWQLVSDEGPRHSARYTTSPR